jgi:hypothetical protein
LESGSASTATFDAIYQICSSVFHHANQKGQHFRCAQLPPLWQNAWLICISYSIGLWPAGNTVAFALSSLRFKVKNQWLRSGYLHAGVLVKASSIDHILTFEPSQDSIFQGFVLVRVAPKVPKNLGRSITMSNFLSGGLEQRYGLSLNYSTPLPKS